MNKGSLKRVLRLNDPVERANQFSKKCAFTYKYPMHGGIAQLVEHTSDTRKATGSIPVSTTGGRQ